MNLDRSSVGEGVFAALGSIVLPKICVGDWSMLGAGAMGTKHIFPSFSSDRFAYTRSNNEQVYD